MRIFVAAATAECAVSAIQNGADGVLLSPSIPPESLSGFFPYARARGIATVSDCSRVCSDAELDRRAETLRGLYTLGLDGIIAGDPGTLRMAKMVAPGCEFIWGGLCQTTEDIGYAAENGCARAVLSPFNHRSAVQSLAAASKLPLLFWAFCPLCPGGDRNGCLMDRERESYECSQICRRTQLAYTGEAVRPLLKTRDLSLLKHLKELGGMTALIAPPSPLPEAAGLFTRIARAAADENYVNERELNEALTALGRERPSDAPFTGNGNVYAPEDLPEFKNDRYWEAERKSAGERGERACVPVRFFALITAGEPARLAVDDYKGHTLYAEGEAPEKGGADDAEEELNKVWRGVSGVYTCKDARTKIEPGVRLARPQAEALRNTVMAMLEDARRTLPDIKPGAFRSGAKLLPRADKPRITIRVAKMSQITPELLRLPPERLYIPLDEASGDPSKAEWLVKSETVPVAVLPRVMTEEDRAEVTARLRMLHDAGFREALTWNPGQALLAQKQGFTPRADWSAASSQTFRAARLMGVASCTVAPWLSLSQIGQMSHICDTELIVYGRLPLLLARQCLIKRKDGLCVCENKCELSDGQGGLLPLIKEGAHSTLVYHPQKLWLLPHRALWRHIGLWAGRLDFVNESALECVKIALAFAERGDYEPHAYTTGFYLSEEPKKRKGRR
jgi:putative protease